MKKLLAFLLIFIALPVFSQTTEDTDMVVLQNLGLIDKPASKISTPRAEIKKLFRLHEKYTNAQDVENLKTIYANKYISFDGFNRDIYIKLAENSWKTYKNLKYKCFINNIQILDDNNAQVEVEEYITGLSYVGTKYIKEGYGFLDNYSKCIYILENINGKWQIVSDNIYFEQTKLTYGNAKFTPFTLISPPQVNAGEKYTIGLKVVPPQNSMIIASLNKENVTYPQISAEEVFRNLPDSGLLERVIKANSKNINEYAVTFFVIMKINNSSDIETMKMKVTGVGLGMNRVNVVPKNKYIKVEDGKDKEHK